MNDDIDPKTIAFIQAFTAIWPDSKNGPAHVVLSDYNVDDSFIRACEKEIINQFVDSKNVDDYAGHSTDELLATASFLQSLRAIPEDRR